MVNDNRISQQHHHHHSPFSTSTLTPVSPASCFQSPAILVSTTCPLALVNHSSIQSLHTPLNHDLHSSSPVASMLLSSPMCSPHRVSFLSCLLIAALACIISLPSTATALTGYKVSHQNAPNQLPSAYMGTMNKQFPLGPFSNKSELLSESDVASGLYASWWQTSFDFPHLPGLYSAQKFVFPFFGVNYTSVTVTSKGFIYLGSYSADEVDSTLPKAQFAPDYSTDGTGFPSLDGEDVKRPVISFAHSMGGAVLQTSLLDYGATTGCQAGTGPCQIQNYFYEVIPPISSYMSVSVGPRKQPTLMVLAPTNSIGTPADGFRFVLAGLQLRDMSGVAASVIVVLYESGLIEIFFYTIGRSGAATLDYELSVLLSEIDIDVSATAGMGYVSCGIQGLIDGTSKHFTLDLPSVTQVDYSTFQSHMAGSAVSFKPQ